MIRALLIGKEPAADLGYAYVREAPYDVVVIGSLTLGQLLRFCSVNDVSAEALHVLEYLTKLYKGLEY